MLAAGRHAHWGTELHARILLQVEGAPERQARIAGKKSSRVCRGVAGAH